MNIILASQSPRRQELLAKMGLKFEVHPSDFDERLDDSRSPQEVATALALGKAAAVAAQFPDALVIGADTIVTINGQQLGKPSSLAEATAMLRQLAGHAHDVTTGIALVCLSKDIQISDSDTTQVIFKPRNDEAIDKYVVTGDPLDKAGAYGIQSGASPLIDHIVGNYETVIGLPTKLLAQHLAEFGVSVEVPQMFCPVPQQNT